VVNFENTIIIMTSNAGTSIKAYGIGFSQDVQKDIESRVQDALKNIFRPEFLNRVDNIITFNQLTRENLLAIADLMLQEVLEEAKEKKVTFFVTDSAKNFLIEKGYDVLNGARPLRRAIQKYIEDELSDIYLKGLLAPGTNIKIDLKDDKLSFEPQ
jgi:ATP-dependent Clp protease ATP-binding subunit ClpA